MQTQAVVFTAPNQVAVREVPLAEPGPRDAVVEIVYSGVSAGTERWILSDRYKGVTYPLVPGYQASGRVVATGAAVQGVATGQWVHVTGTRLAPDAGERAMWGGHVALAVCAAAGLFPLPPGCPPTGAALARLAAVPLHGLELCGVAAGELVVILGLGFVGQVAAQLAKAAGATVIGSDVIKSRVELCRRLGADEAVVASGGDDLLSAVKRLKPDGADLLIDTTAHAGALNAGFEVVRRRGRVLLQAYYPGLTALDLFTPHVKELTFYNPTDSTPDGIRQSLQAMADGRLQIEPLITCTADAAQAPDVFADVALRPVDNVAAVLRWREEAV